MALKIMDKANADYGELLRKTLPRVIRDDRENDRLIAEIEHIDSLPNPTKEELELAELMGLLVGEYEKRYDLGELAPVDALKELMEFRNLRQRDLIPVFGSSSVTSDVLNGKREISKEHARRLAEFFSVSVALFIGII